MGEKNKYLLVTLMLAVMSLPLVQTIYPLFSNGELHGKQVRVEPPVWTWEHWFSGKWQEQAGWYCTQETGFRPWLIRFNNQLHYSLYRRAQVNSVVIGKNGYLYDKLEVQSYTGEYFIGKEKWRNIMQRLDFVQDTMSRIGVRLVLVMAPNKAFYFPEHLPPGTPSAGTVTNASEFLRLADSMHIPVLNLSEWYVSLKDTTHYPLFTRGGMHWSVLGAAYAADTFSRYLSQLENAPIPRLKVQQINWSPIPLLTDNDLGEGMNLLFPYAVDSCAYPEVQITGGPPRIKLLTVGDSFYHLIFNEHTGKIFEKSQYWFNFGDFYTFGEGMKTSADVDFQKEVEEKDVVVLFLCHINLPKMTETFAHRLYSIYSDPDGWKSRIPAYESRIREDANWMQDIQKKAEERGISVDSMVRLDAEYSFRMDREKMSR